MITNNVLQRVFYIQIGSHAGTGFAIEHMNKQYLVTARHLVTCSSDKVKISIFHNDEWKLLTATLVGIAKEKIDIAVFALNFQLAPTYPFIPSMKDIVLGQQVFFLGFPLGMTGGHKEINRDFPLPLIKAGILSGMVFSSKSNKIWIDGHNNKGFSGGPVVFIPDNQSPSKNKEYQVAGVISGYMPFKISVYGTDGNKIGFTPENTGIFLAYDILHAIELIEENPIGYGIDE